MNKLKPLAVKLQANERYQRVLKNKSQTVSLRCGYVNLRPKEAVGEHSTDKKEEAIVVLSGKAEVSCQGQRPFIAKTNSVVYIPPDTRHNVKNIDTKTLRYLYMVNPV